MASVVVQTPFNEYDGNGVTTVYPYSFQLLASTDLVVKVGGVAQVSGFTVSGIGNQSGGNVTFTTPPPVGTKNILLSRELKLERDTDYQYSGDLREETVDRDFNRLWQVAQGQDAIQDGTLRAPYPEQLNPLPSAATRANTVQAYDGSGQPTVQVPASGSAADVLLQLANTSNAALGAAIVGRGVQVVDSIAALRGLLKTSASTRAFVTGYYAAGDGGGGPYRYDSSDTTSADNGGTIIVASDGGRWKLVYVGAINVRQFGAKGDDTTDDTTAFTSANAASLNLYVPAGTFKLTNWQPLNGTKLHGAGYLVTFIKQGAAGSPAIFINNGN